MKLTDELRGKPRVRPLPELVEDGTVLDFSSESKRQCFPGRIFVQATLWRDVWKQSHARLTRALECSAGIWTWVMECEEYGMTDLGEGEFAYLVEPSEEFGCPVLVLFESGGEEALGLKRWTEGRGFRPIS